jgi:hypothetical protein
MTKKKIILILLLLNIVFSAGMTFAYWASSILGNSQPGTGTVDIGDWGTPIFTTTEFYNFVNRTTSVSTEKYYLANNLDFSSYTWTPIAATRIFRGTLNGNGKTISNLTINYNSSTIAYSGIFPRLDGATITNLTLDNVQIVSYLSGTTRVAGLISGDAYNANTVNLSRITVRDSGVQGRSGSGVGGLIGFITGTNTTVIMNNIKASNLKAFNINSYAGGLVGSVASNSRLEMYDVDFSGEAYSNNSSSYVGGLVGYVLSNGYLTIERAVVEASFQNTQDTGSYTDLYSARYLGGIVGRNATVNARVVVSDTYFTGFLFPSTATRRGDVGTFAGAYSNLATLTRSSYARVGFRPAVGTTPTYTVPTVTGQNSTVVPPNNATAPTNVWWNTFYSNFDGLIWAQDGSGRPYLIR